MFDLPLERRAGLLPLPSLLLAALAGCRSSEGDPLSPGEAMQSFAILDGFHVELFAA
jgi:hypothetical protein